MSSITIMPCGPPKPRNAVCDVLLVLAIRPFTRMFGIQYALSMWHSARASTGSDRSRLQPPSAVRVASSAGEPAVVVEADPPLGVEAVPLAGHGQVLGAVQPQPDRPAGDHRAERGDRGEAVRLHLLAAEPAAHPQALHGDLVARPAEHVGDDLLRLGRVLGAGLDEDLPALVDVGQGAVGLQVEVLLAGELEHAGEDVRRRLASPASTSPRSTVGCAPWNSRAAIASLTSISAGSGSTSTTTAAAPSRAASSVSPST